MTPLTLIFAGSGAFGLPTLRALLDAGHTVAQIVTQPDRPAGRGRRPTPTPIAAFAAERNLPLLKTDDINREALPSADAMVVIAFGQKIAQAVADAPRLGSLNLHASLLPKYRGAAPIHWALLNGETKTGNSVIRLASRMDAGAVLGQATLPIKPTDTTGDLHDRLANDGAKLALKVLDELAAGTAVEQPQDDALASAAPKLSREQAAIDFARPAAEVVRTINGLSPWPGCRVSLLDAAGNVVDRLTLLRAGPATAGRPDPSADCGGIDQAGRVHAGGGPIHLLDLQPDGKRPMPLADYVNGNAWTAGMKLVGESAERSGRALSGGVHPHRSAID